MPCGGVRCRLAPFPNALALILLHPLSHIHSHTHTSTLERFDYLIVGCGFAGATLAERLANDGGKTVLVIDRRSHIGGNAYDCYNDAGLLIHPYGPHIFHTNSRDVFDYLGQFTAWRPYEHTVLASVDGQQVPIPINLDTVNSLYNLNLSSDQLEDWFAERAEAV